MKLMWGLVGAAALGAGSYYFFFRKKTAAPPPKTVAAGAGFQPLDILAGKQPGLAPFFGAAQSSLGGVFPPQIRNVIGATGGDPNTAAAIGAASQLARATPNAFSRFFGGNDPSPASPGQPRSPVPNTRSSFTGADESDPHAGEADRAEQAQRDAIFNDFNGTDSANMNNDGLSTNGQSFDVSGNGLDSWGSAAGDPLANTNTAQDNFNGYSPNYEPSGDSGNDPYVPDPYAGAAAPDFASPPLDTSGGFNDVGSSELAY